MNTINVLKIIITIYLYRRNLTNVKYAKLKREKIAFSTFRDVHFNYHYRLQTKCIRIFRKQQMFEPEFAIKNVAKVYLVKPKILFLVLFCNKKTYKETISL